MAHHRMTVGEYVRRNSISPGAPDSTRATYKRGASEFQADCREQGISLKQLCDGRADPVATIQDYERRMEGRGLSPDTIHTRLAPVCRAFHVGMDAIDKPRRTADTITRSRRGGNERGKKEMVMERYARPVAMQNAIGVREAELFHICGRDLTTDESGYLCVHIESGKGGKPTKQRVLPENEMAVRFLFTGVAPDERVFSEHEHARHIDYHGMRHEAAQRAYDYYAGRLSSEKEYRAECRAQLMSRWREGHPRPLDSDIKGLERYNAQYRAFEAEINREGLYKTRGAVRESAERNGRPVEYDRMAVMMVSVFHLSHWRADVTVKNYLTA